MAKLTVNGRLKRRIANTKREVFMREDFQDIASPSQLSAALKELCETGFVVRIGYGVYAKATINKITGKPRPRVDLSQLAAEFLTKRGVPAVLGKAQREYAEKKTTQIPMTTAFYTGKRRVSRRISIGNTFVKYENAY